MGEKKNGLPSLHKTPLDFLSRDEARQATKAESALDRALPTTPRPETPATKSLTIGQPKIYLQKL